MRTKEVIKRIKALGYQVSKRGFEGREIKALGIYNEHDVATVSEDETFSMDTRFYGFMLLEESERIKLYNLLDIYVRTPLEDRKEEEMHYYYLEGLEEGENYINYVDDEIRFDDKIEVENEIKTKFTESDIKEMRLEQQKIFELAKRERVNIQEAEDIGG